MKDEKKTSPTKAQKEDAETAVGEINLDDAVREGRQILAQDNKNQWRLAVIREQREHRFDTSLAWVSGPDNSTAPERSYAAQRLSAYIRAHERWI